MPTDDFRPFAQWPVLQLRATLLQRLREFFARRDFWEVETPLLSADTVVDRHLDPLTVTLAADARHPAVGPTYYLQTSPEFSMKRLLAAGATAIYQVAKAFRLAERGPLHNPEFTMVEWYRVNDDYTQGRALLAELATELLQRGEVRQLSYQQAFVDAMQLDPHTASIEELAAAAQQLGVAVPASWQGEDRDAWLDLLLVEQVQPTLTGPRPIILYDFPASQAALAQVRVGPPAVAERFELYVDGIELANGYHELLDAGELRRRNVRANQQRLADGKPTLPEDSRLLAAMDAGLPACSGVALGFDRLVMVAAGATSIDQVLAFPSERA